jgi:hypothetical protein
MSKIKDEEFFGFNHTSDTIENEEIERINKATHKNQFSGKKGQMLHELQKSYKNDTRFGIGKVFKGDIDIKKVPESLRLVSNAFDSSDKNFHSKKQENNHIKEENSTYIEEKNKNLQVLSTVLSNKDFLSTPKRIYNDPRNFIIKRYDPVLKIGQSLLKNKVEEKKIPEKDEKIIKLEKGVDPFPIKDIKGDIFTNKMDSKSIKKMKKREKEKVLNTVINEVNSGLEPTVEIKLDTFKKISKGEGTNKITFNLFGPSKSDEDDQEINSTEMKNEEIPLIKKEKKKLDKEPLTEEELLKRKRLKEKKLDKKKEKTIKNKELKQAEKEREQEKDIKVESKLRKNMLKEFDQTKVSDYMKYINMIKDSKGKEKKK